MTAATTLDAALAYLRAGLSLIPIARDGTKRPASHLLPTVWDEGADRGKATWKPFQERIPTEDEVRVWFGGQTPPGIATIGGAVSGHLEQLDFDRDAETLFPAWSEMVEAECPGLIARLSIARTPRQPCGYHVRYRCPEVEIPGNTDLAMDPDAPAAKERTLIQTRGEGGYALSPGSPGCCHETGGTYEHHSGPKLSQVGAVSADERDVLIRCARYFDRRVSAEPAGLKPGEDFERRGPDWAEILEPHGWTCTSGRAGGERRWRRPGKTGHTWSATTGKCHGGDGADLLRVFSSNADPFEAGKAYGKFRAWALLNHRGDWSAAAKELATQGYGEQRRPTQPSRNGKTPAHQASTIESSAALPVLKRMRTVAPTTVEWTWPGWLPRGTLAVLDGDPGMGKSTVTLDIAARLSRGWRMPPEGGSSPNIYPVSVLLLSAEDDLGYTIRPRLDAAGADVDRVHAFDAVDLGKGQDRPPVLPWDFDLILNLAKDLGVALIIVDPLTAYLASEFDAHKDQDIRRCLHHMDRFARKLSLTVLLVRHLNKLSGGPALYRGGGSIAISGAARASLVVGRDPDDEQRHVLAMNKLNVGPTPTSLAYRIEQASPSVTRIAWEGECDLRPEDILWHRQGRAPGRPDDQLQDACRLLESLLADGPLTAEEVNSAAQANLVSTRTLARAKATLGIESARDGRGPWLWSLPNMR